MLLIENEVEIFEWVAVMMFFFCRNIVYISIFFPLCWGLCCLNV